MTIQELKISSYLIQRFSNDDKSYIGIANSQLNLKIKEDQKRKVSITRKCKPVEIIELSKNI